MQFCLELEKKEHIKNILWITAAFFLTHGFILVLTGTWWDEKTWAFSTSERMWNAALQLGRPSVYFLMKFIFDVPEAVARIIIVLCFYFATLGVYFIYNQLPGINDKNALMMTLLYVAIPSNDARALRGVFPYTFGFFLFIAASCLLIVLQKKYDYKNICLRLLTLLLFAGSFALNSNLVFYAVPLLYILCYVVKNKQVKTCYKYSDFVILPIAFFVLKTRLFPAHGIYDGYNSVNMKGLITGIPKSIIICFYRLKDIITLWMNYWAAGILFVTGIVAAIWWMKKRSIDFSTKSACPEPSDSLFWKKLSLLPTGLITMWLGVYAYAVVGQSCDLTGVGGRSSILLAAGAAVLLFSVIIWIPFDLLKMALCVFAVFCGILHFNSFYLSYQKDYFRQMDLEYELCENYQNLQETKNILYLTESEPKVDTTRFYTLNSNGKDVFGDQSHFFMNGFHDVSYLEDDSQMEQFVKNGDYQMADYEVGRSKKVEATIIYNNSLSAWDTLILRITELFNQRLFEEKLYGERNMIVYTPEMSEFAVFAEQ